MIIRFSYQFVPETHDTPEQVLDAVLGGKLILRNEQMTEVLDDDGKLLIKESSAGRVVGV